MQNSKVHFTQRKHLVCSVGGGAFKFKEEKNHGVVSEMTEAFGSKKLWKERQGNNHNGQIEIKSSPPAHHHHPLEAFYDLLADDSNYIS